MLRKLFQAKDNSLLLRAKRCTLRKKPKNFQIRIFVQIGSEECCRRTGKINFVDLKSHNIDMVPKFFPLSRLLGGCYFG